MLLLVPDKVIRKCNIEDKKSTSVKQAESFFETIDSLHYSKLI